MGQDRIEKLWVRNKKLGDRKAVNNGKSNELINVVVRLLLSSFILEKRVTEFIQLVRNKAYLWATFHLNFWLVIFFSIIYVSDRTGV